MNKFTQPIKSIIPILLLILILYFVTPILITPRQRYGIDITISYEKITPFNLNSSSITYNQNNSLTNTNFKPNSSPITTRQDVINRAKSMVEVRWSPKKNLRTKTTSYIFLKGKVYYGIPYSMGDYQTASSSDFLSKLNSTNYLIGNDCSGFISAAWGIRRQTTLSLFDATKKGLLIDGKAVNQIPWNDIKAGDALLKDNGKGKGHIMLYLYTDTKNPDLLTVYEQNVATSVPFQPIPTARKDIRSKNTLIKSGYFPIRLMTLN